MRSTAPVAQKPISESWVHHQFASGLRNLDSLLVKFIDMKFSYLPNSFILGLKEGGAPLDSLAVGLIGWNIISQPPAIKLSAQIINFLTSGAFPELD